MGRVREPNLKPNPWTAPKQAMKGLEQSHRLRQSPAWSSSKLRDCLNQMTSCTLKVRKASPGNSAEQWGGQASSDYRIFFEFLFCVRDRSPQVCERAVSATSGMNDIEMLCRGNFAKADALETSPSIKEDGQRNDQAHGGLPQKKKKKKKKNRVDIDLPNGLQVLQLLPVSNTVSWIDLCPPEEESQQTAGAQQDAILICQKMQCLRMQDLSLNLLCRPSFPSLQQTRQTICLHTVMLMLVSCLQLPSKVKLSSQTMSKKDEDPAQGLKEEQNIAQIQPKGTSLPAKPSQLRPAPADSQVPSAILLLSVVTGEANLRVHSNFLSLGPFYM